MYVCMYVVTYMALASADCRLTLCCNAFHASSSWPSSCSSISVQYIGTVTGHLMQLSFCMYVCMYACIYVCVVCIHIRVHVTCVYVRMLTDEKPICFVMFNVCTYVCVCVCVCVCMWAEPVCFMVSE